MCGRYAVYSGFDHPNYNASPGQFLPVILSQDNKTQMHLMRWGLIPSWAKDDKYAQINARSETLTEKKTFKNLLKHGRCLIPTNGFFEWGLRNNQKWPFFFKLKDRKLFAFAGLFSNWETPDGSPISTYTIITTQANSLVKPVHDRMPVIVPSSKESLWLDPHIDPSKVTPILQPFSSDSMEFFPVSIEINTPDSNSPELIRPLSTP